MGDKVKSILIKAALSFAVGSAGSMLFFGEGANGWYIAGSVVAGASIISDVAGKFLLPLLPQSESWANLEGKAIGLALSGVGTWGIIKLLVNPNAPFVQTSLLGAGSYAISDYVSSSILKVGQQSLL